MPHKQSHVIDLTITIVSPVHVGGQQEKHLKKGLDFSHNEGKLSIIDWEQTVANNSNNRSNILSDMAQGRVAPNPVYKVYFDRIYPWKGRIGSDLKCFIKNGFNVPFLPGSSLKGALRSTMLEAYQLQPGAFASTTQLEKKTIGTFSESLFSQVLVRDTSFHDSLSLCNSKIYNLDSNRDGAWKNTFRNGNDSNFKEEGFSTLAECLTPGARKPGQIVFKTPAYPERFTGMSSKNQKVLKEDWSQDPWQWMVHHARNYMQRYLTAEVAYFDRFNQAEHHDEVLEAYQSLQKFHENLSRDQILIRMGWGSGSHQMTGNWQFPDHAAIAAQMKMKSRKIAFWRNKEQLQFAPMGFLLLEKSAGRDAELSLPFDAGKSAQLVIDKVQSPLSVEKPTPAFVDSKMLRTNSEVFGEVIGTEGQQVKVKLFIQGFEGKAQSFRYPAGIENGKIIVLRLSFLRRKLSEGFNLSFLKYY